MILSNGLRLLKEDSGLYSDIWDISSSQSDRPGGGVFFFFFLNLTGHTTGMSTGFVARARISVLVAARLTDFCVKCICDFFALFVNIGIVCSCINICRVPRKLFEHEAARLCA